MKENGTPTLFVTGIHPLVGRNIFATPVLRMLAREAHLVLFVPDFKVSYFERQFGGPEVKIEGVSIGASMRTCFDLRSTQIAHAMLDTVSMRHTYGGRLKNHGMRKQYMALYVPARLLGKSRLVRGLYRMLDRRFSPSPAFSAFFDRYRPDALFSTDATDKYDVQFMHHARARGIPIISMVRSFDNLTKLGILRIIPDLLLVWSEELKRYAIDYHDVPEEAVEVVGVPHYDRYKNGSRMPRSEFLRRYHLTPAKKIIFFSPTGAPRLMHNDADRTTLEILSRMEATVFVRLPPTNPVEGIEDRKWPANVTLEKPGVAFDAGSLNDAVLTPDDDQTLADELAVSDLVVCGPSTIAIDASVFDKPTILLNFDGHPGEPYLDDAYETYQANHMQSIIRSGGVRMANSEAELIGWIRKYLADPLLDRDGRSRLAQEQCFKLDGKSSERVAEAVLRMIP